MVLDAVTVCCIWNSFYLLVQLWALDFDTCVFLLVRFSCCWWFSTPGVLCPDLVPLGWLDVVWLPWRCRVLEEHHTLDDSVFALDSWFLCWISCEDDQMPRCSTKMVCILPVQTYILFLSCSVWLCVLCGCAHIYFSIHLLLYKVSRLWSAERSSLLRAYEETFTSFLNLSM